jgi:secreted Zn-dependent insulinase-like peptidase
VKGRTVYAHRLIAETAKAMAHEAYAELMRDNAVYAIWLAETPGFSPKAREARFVELMTPHLLEAARATLAAMLAGNLSESLKTEIYSALLRDRQLQPTRLGQGPG